jgi:hypothetical protein
VPTAFGYGSVSLDRFDLGPGLRSRLEAWAKVFDALADTDYQWPLSW